MSTKIACLFVLHFPPLQVTKKALEIINPDKKLPLHVSLDIDVLDPIEAPATGTRGNRSYKHQKYTALHDYYFHYIQYLEA